MQTLTDISHVTDEDLLPLPLTTVISGNAAKNLIASIDPLVCCQTIVIHPESAIAVMAEVICACLALVAHNTVTSERGERAFGFNKHFKSKKLDPSRGNAVETPRNCPYWIAS